MSAEVDVGRLPEHVYDHRALVIWANLGLIAIESTTFAMAFWAYFYYRMTAREWPPPNLSLPDLRLGVANVAVLLASCIPFRIAGREAAKGPEADRGRIRAGLAVNLLFGLGFVALRALEFRDLGFRWSANAYASSVWAILVLHGGDTLAAVVETGVVLAVFVLGPVKEKDFTDVRADAFFWYFLVAAGVASAAVVYGAPRLL